MYTKRTKAGQNFLDQLNSGQIIIDGSSSCFRIADNIQNELNISVRVQQKEAIEAICVDNGDSETPSTECQSSHGIPDSPADLDKRSQSVRSPH